jgi:hypothetical protein
MSQGNLLLQTGLQRRNFGSAKGRLNPSAGTAKMSQPVVEVFRTMARETTNFVMLMSIVVTDPPCYIKLRGKTMRKINQNGFSVIEGLIAIVVIVVIGLAGWLVYQRNNDTRDQTTATVAPLPPETYQRTKNVPADWTEYTNDEYGFRFVYPAGWKIEAFKVPDGAKPSDEDPAKENDFAVDFRPTSDGEMVVQHSFRVTHQSLNGAIAERKRIVANTRSSDDGVILKITNEKRYIFDDYDMVRIDMESDDGTPPNSYSTEFYIQADDKVYVFDSGFQDKKLQTDDELMTVFESIRIR